MVTFQKVFLPLSTIVPELKNKSGDVRDVSNYRPIAVATITSKLFESVVLQKISEFLSTRANQFGFKADHSTDMATFLVKQTIAHYNKHGSPVFVIFLDASKVFDRVNHSPLVDKLIKRGVPLCFVRIIDYWYREQQMHVTWGSSYSSFFSVSNGVRQGGILSPFLFAVYMDDLSSALNNQAVGCYLGNTKVNHILFADDLCCICPSVHGLLNLLSICEEYAASHDIIFNHTKTVGVMFNCSTSFISLNFEPNVYLNSKKIILVKKVKYLGVLLENNLKDDIEINRQVRSFYYTANKLKARFSKCSTFVKNALFCSFCYGMYAC